MSWRTGRSRFAGDPRRTGMRRARLTDRGVTGGGAGGKVKEYRSAGQGIGNRDIRSKIKRPDILSAPQHTLTTLHMNSAPTPGWPYTETCGRLTC